MTIIGNTLDNGDVNITNCRWQIQLWYPLTPDPNKGKNQLFNVESSFGPLVEINQN